MQQVSSATGTGPKPSTHTRRIFVFGSDLAGRHTHAAARVARLEHQAQYGIAFGITGNAFGIPTRDRELRPLPITRIATLIGKFIWYAQRTPQRRYQVQRLGCGNEGYDEPDMGLLPYQERDIAALFRDAPDNCELPQGWREWGAQACAANMASGA